MPKPLFVYDGNCGFCRRGVTRLRKRTGGRVRYRPLQQPGLLSRLHIPPGAAGRAAQLVEPNGERLQGAAAILGALAHAPGRHPIARALRLPGARLLSDAAYRSIADHRRWFSTIDRAVDRAPWRRPSRSMLDDPAQLLERALGGVWLAAFWSLRRQVRGLWGEQGILPIAQLLAAAKKQLAPRERLHLLPTLFWIDAGDAQLERACIAGEWLAGCVALGIAPRASAWGVWALYLSFVSVGRDFLGFQWDALLLEAGLLAAVGAPLWMYRWLLCRLYFESGLAKLRAPDRSWRTGGALRHYYETAPLPTRLGWWAHQLPRWVQGWSTALTVVHELGAPFLVLLPGRARLGALGLMNGFQLAIASTANYGFFNLLSVVLSLSLLPQRTPRRRSLAGRIAGLLLSLPLFALSSTHLLRRLGLRKRRLARFDDWSAPFFPVSAYGLFASMTLERPEIEIEGSNDGLDWKQYRFRYKVGPLDRPPPLVAPHQPRLDWQMWFAALTGPPRWFVSLLARLLEGAPQVTALLAFNPFAEHPPKYVRAILWDYRMTDRKTRRRTGRWWTRRRLGTYFPPAVRAE